jgi:leucyl aminopeptidase
MATQVDVVAPGAIEADVLAVPVAQPTAKLDAAAAAVDARIGGRIAALASAGDVTGRAGAVVLLHDPPDLGVPRVALAGLGARERLDADSFRTAAAAVARAAGAFGGTVAWLLDDSIAVPLDVQAGAIVEGTLLGAYDPGRWKTGDDRRREISRLSIATDADVAAATRRAEIVARWTNRARDLSNEPPNMLYPETLAERATDVAATSDALTIEVLGPAELEELGAGAILAVGSGSNHPPRLIVLRYDPPGAPEEPVLGLVGKAITFDTGGLSIKTAGGMVDMKGDMSGGGVVICGIGALADLALPVRAIAVVASAENAIDAESYRPSDILTAMNGKTIEITNTDAEGRLVLADALWHTRQLGATHMVDFATLTGAMELALGDLYAGVFVNDDAWWKTIEESSETSGDKAWRFPLHPRYRRYIDSTYADMMNSSSLRQGSPALAAEFLHEFVGEGPWAHFDMAGTGFLERSRGDYLTTPGGTGYGVRLIAEVASRMG